MMYWCTGVFIKYTENTITIIGQVAHDNFNNISFKIKKTHKTMREEFEYNITQYKKFCSYLNLALT